jgi:hypothetical protein
MLMKTMTLPSFRRMTLFVIVSLLSACSMERSEIARLVSPDHRATAVLTQEVGGGAAGAGVYSLYLTDVEDKELKRPNFVATGCPGLSIAWMSPRVLKLNYPQDCAIKQFVNLWYSRLDVKNARPASVEIVLAETADNGFARQ